jgi:uncharacterized protein YneF (UPF0154 family)
MSESGKTVLSILVIIISLIILGFVLKFYLSDIENEHYLKNNGKLIKGIVVEKKHGRKSKTYITCKYVYNNRNYYIKENVNKFEYLHDVEINVGDSLGIFIESKNPKNSVIDLNNLIMKEKKDNSLIKKILPIVMAIIGFVLYQIITIPMGFKGISKSIGAGVTMVVFYYLGTLLNKFW